MYLFIYIQNERQGKVPHTPQMKNSQLLQLVNNSGQENWCKAMNVHNHLSNNLYLKPTLEQQKITSYLEQF